MEPLPDHITAASSPSLLLDHLGLARYKVNFVEQECERIGDVLVVSEEEGQHVFGITAKIPWIRIYRFIQRIVDRDLNKENQRPFKNNSDLKTPREPLPAPLAVTPHPTSGMVEANPNPDSEDNSIASNPTDATEDTTRPSRAATTTAKRNKKRKKKDKKEQKRKSTRHDASTDALITQVLARVAHDEKMIRATNNTAQLLKQKEWYETTFSPSKFDEESALTIVLKVADWVLEAKQTANGTHTSTSLRCRMQDIKSLLEWKKSPLPPDAVGIVEALTKLLSDEARIERRQACVSMRTR